MKNIKCFIASKKNDRFEFEEEDMLGGCTPSEYDKWPGGHFKKVLKINNYPETTFVIYSKDRLEDMDLINLKKDWEKFCSIS
ncbi:hypothetical protein [Acinetobacter sp. CE-15]|uniref:hypothetical protein n=1 Tax=Acinetobacter sp. CE-15 TaxID=3425693 RepID=UPI003DA55149